MANSFSKEERVAFEDILSGFNDALVLSSLVTKYNTNGTQMERSSDTAWVRLLLRNWHRTSTSPFWPLLPTRARSFPSAPPLLRVIPMLQRLML
jgi:hypothetical protein